MIFQIYQPVKSWIIGEILELFFRILNSFQEKRFVKMLPLPWKYVDTLKKKFMHEFQKFSHKLDFLQKKKNSSKHFLDEKFKELVSLVHLFIIQISLSAMNQQEIWINIMPWKLFIFLKNSIKNEKP